MSKFIDTTIALRILRLLTTPFEKTDAYRLGIIDERGRELKRLTDLHTQAERDAYTILHRMIFRLKKIIQRVPTENKRFSTYAAALSLVREHYTNQKEPIDLEAQFLAKMQEDLHEEEEFVRQVLVEDRYILSLKHFREEAPANNAVSTPGMAGLTPETTPVKKRPRITRRGTP